MATEGSAQWKRHNGRVWGYCLIAGTLAVLYGMGVGQTSGFFAMARQVTEYNYDFGTYNPATKAKVLTAPQISGIAGSALGAAVVGAAFAGTVGTRFGRKWGLLVAALAYIIGIATAVGALDFQTVIVGRVFAGLGVGLAANFIIPYWAETTPKSLRGLIIVMYQALINIAQFVGASINKGTSDLTTRWAYRGPLLTELLMPILCVTFVYFMPETPRWYVTRGRYDKARESMRRLRGPSWPPEEIDAEVNDIIGMYEIEKQLEGTARWAQCFQGTDLRRTLLTIGCLLSQELSGVAFIAGYGTYFFSLSGVNDPFLITVISSMCGIAGSLSSFFLIKYVSRRVILIVGTVTQSVCMFIFAIVGVATPGTNAAAKCLVAFVCIFTFSYGASWGPVSFVLVGELPSTKLRSKTVALATSIGWVLNVLISVGMPYLLNATYINLGTKIGFIFGATELLSLVFVVFFLPETKDRTLEEIDEMFMNKVPAWNFSKYVTTRTVQGVSVQEKVAHVVGLDKATVSNVERVA